MFIFQLIQVIVIKLIRMIEILIFRLILGERKHVCNICNSTFTKAWTLKQHMSIHRQNETDSSMYQCHQCSFLSSDKEELESHIMSHEDDSRQTTGLIKDSQLSAFDANLSDEVETEEYDLVEIQTF
jgi:Zinc finger, C2H2 type